MWILTPKILIKAVLSQGNFCREFTYFFPHPHPDKKYANQNTKYTNQNTKYTNQNTKYANQNTKYANQNTKYANQNNKYTSQNTKYALFWRTIFKGLKMRWRTKKDKYEVCKCSLAMLASKAWNFPGPGDFQVLEISRG